MNAALAAALFGACVALSACATPPAPAPALPPGAGEAAASRQVLVMLRMPAQHFRAGSAYDGGYPTDDSHAARRRAAQELAREHNLRLLDDWPMPVIGIDCFVMERPAGMPAGDLLAALARDPRVAWAQPVNLFRGLDGDPLYPVQPDGRYWHLAELHRISTGRGVRVAVIDSGIDARHPDLQGQFAIEEDFVGAQPVAEPHGTAVAGIVAARSGNGLGIAGVAPGARLMALRACWQAPHEGARCSSFTLGKALNFALMHDARIINLSLTGPADRLLEALLDAAAARGTAVVGAIDPASPDGGFPASAPGVLAVAAQPSAQTQARVQPQAQARAQPPASARPGALFAPGTDIPTCVPGGGWGFVSGASYAAAHVSGLVALLAQLQPHASPAQLKRDIVASGDSTPLRQAANHGEAAAAAGSIDACATIARVAGRCTCSCPPAGAPQASLGR